MLTSGVFYTIAWFFEKGKNQLQIWESSISKIYTWIATIFSWILIVQRTDYFWDNPEWTLAVFLLIAIITGITYFLRYLHITKTNLYAALIYTTITIAIQFEPEWITLAWIFEILLITIAAFQLQKFSSFKYSIYGLSILTASKILLYDTSTILVSYPSNIRVVVFLLATLVFYSLAIFIRHREFSLRQRPQGVYL